MSKPSYTNLTSILDKIDSIIGHLSGFRSQRGKSNSGSIDDKNAMSIQLFNFIDLLSVGC